MKKTSSRLFFKTSAGALSVGFLLVAFVGWDWFVPGALIGLVAGLLTWGVRESEPTILDVLKKQQDTEIFRTFMMDLLGRMPEVMNPSAFFLFSSRLILD
jgi:hypothetical protein